VNGNAEVTWLQIDYYRTSSSSHYARNLQEWSCTLRALRQGDKALQSLRRAATSEGLKAAAATGAVVGGLDLLRRLEIQIDFTGYPAETLRFVVGFATTQRRAAVSKSEHDWWTWLYDGAIAEQLLRVWKARGESVEITRFDWPVLDEQSTERVANILRYTADDLTERARSHPVGHPDRTQFGAAAIFCLLLAGQLLNALAKREQEQQAGRKPN
jgi:hypothetical protein